MCLALTSCVTGGAMDVVVAGGSTRHPVSAAVLANWAAVSGLVGSLVYTVAEEVWGPFLLSASFPWHSWQSWQSVAIYIGGYLIFYAVSYCSIVLSGLGVSGLVAFTTLTRSLQLISPNLVASLRCLELVLAFLLQTVGAPTKHTRGVAFLC